MTAYNNALERLQTAIVANKPELAMGLLGRKTSSLPSRLNAYIQGYRIRLSKTMAADYPALNHYLGEEVFNQYVHSYVEQTPSHSYSIDPYPIGFAHYLTDHCDSKAAHTIATLESAIAEVFWLPDSPPFIPTTDFSMDHLSTLTLTARTASTRLMLAYDADHYLQEFRHGSPLTEVSPTPTYLLIIRHGNEVKRHRLGEAEYTLLSALDGKNFTQALEQTINQHSKFEAEIVAELGHWLNQWINHGFFKAPQ